MKFIVTNDIFTRRGKKLLWLESGEYPVVRLFGENRVMLDCSTPLTLKRQLTILDLSQGTILNHDSEEEAS